MSQETKSKNHDMDQHDAQDSQNSSESTGAKLAACHQKIGELDERIRYLLADFENYRRNAEKDRSFWYIKAQGEVLLDVVAIVDDFDRAFQVAHQQIKNGSNNELSSWLKGFSFIREALSKMLEKYEVKEMPAQGDFDPERHEALQQVQSADHSSGTIVTVLRKGYLYKGTVLRPAQVTVAQ